MFKKSIEITDDNILLSILNIKLRNQYSSLEFLCYDLECDKEEIINKLRNIGYNYNQEKNQFK